MKPAHAMAVKVLNEVLKHKGQHDLPADRAASRDEVINALRFCVARPHSLTPQLLEAAQQVLAAVELEA